jgi:4'-phosphopantetheinyl transferase
MITSWPKRNLAPQLGAGEVHVWLVALSSDHVKWKRDWAGLCPEERERAEQFPLEEPRRRFVVTRATLRTLLGQYLGCAPDHVTLEFTTHGKPRLAKGQAASGIKFNVAHSCDYALIAITTRWEVGVDIERLRSVKYAEHIARRYFHPTEIETIMAVPPEVRDAVFLRCWTGKEAVLKAIGSGITGALSDFFVPVQTCEGVWIQLPATLGGGNTRCWLHALEPCEGYVSAVACLGAARDVQYFVFDD